MAGDLQRRHRRVGSARSAEELIRWADGGLYAAKHAGKNQDRAPFANGFWLDGCYQSELSCAASDSQRRVR